jgi:hypothetical protein
MTPNQLIDDYFEFNFSISFGIIMSLSAPLAPLSHRATHKNLPQGRGKCIAKVPQTAINY